MKTFSAKLPQIHRCNYILTKWGMENFSDAAFKWGCMYPQCNLRMRLKFTCICQTCYIYFGHMYLLELLYVFLALCHNKPNLNMISKHIEATTSAVELKWLWILKNSTLQCVGLVWMKLKFECCWLSKSSQRKVRCVFALCQCCVSYWVKNIRVRDGSGYRNGWIFGKIPNGLWPPLIFGISYCNFFLKNLL